MLGIRTQLLMFVQQALYPWSHLSSPLIDVFFYKYTFNCIYFKCKVSHVAGGHPVRHTLLGDFIGSVFFFSYSMALKEYHETT